MARPGQPHDDLETDLETDDRFPSGPWIGFYIQWGQRGRQDLNLTFREGVIGGVGRDAAGDFGVRGTYDVESGRCGLVKTYPTHRVEYDGNAEGNGIWGTWRIRGVGYDDTGGFHIWPLAMGEGMAEHVEAEVPVDATR